MIKPLLVLLLSTAFVSLGAHAEDKAVTSISPDRLAINGAEATLGLSQEWVHPKPKIERVVIVLHGRLRNAQTYLRSIERAPTSQKSAARPC